MNEDDVRNKFLQMLRDADFIALRLHAIPSRPVLVTPDAVLSWAETLTDEEVSRLIPLGVDSDDDGITVYVG